MDWGLIALLTFGFRNQSPRNRRFFLGENLHVYSLIIQFYFTGFSNCSGKGEAPLILAFAFPEQFCSGSLDILQRGGHL